MAPKFFHHGWGDLTVAYDAQETFLQRLEQDDLSTITLSNDQIKFTEPTVVSGSKTVTIREGQFESPLAYLLPTESKKSLFYVVEPSSSTSSSSSSKPKDDLYVVMMPATGEQGKRERLQVATELATKYGWKSIIVIAPFYGRRKPKSSSQRLFFLNTVSDALVQSIAVVQETTAITRYFLNKSSSNNSSNPRKVVLTGFSWGSAMSSLITTSLLMSGIDGRRIGHVPYVGSASPGVFVGGVLKNGIDWDALLIDTMERKFFPNVTSIPELEAVMGHELNKTQLVDFIDRYQRKLSMMTPNDVSHDHPKKLNGYHQPYPSIVRMFCMKNDGFITPPYSRVYINHIEQLVQQAPASGHHPRSQCDYRMEWLSGGHVVAAMLRPFYQKRAIIEVGLSLVQSDKNRTTGAAAATATAQHTKVE